jgi:hypothetical protein
MAGRVDPRRELAAQRQSLLHLTYATKNMSEINGPSMLHYS